MIAFAVLAALSASAAPIADGPYVTQSAEGKGYWIVRWIDGDDTAPSTKERRVKVGDEILVPPVGRLPSFTVRLRAPSPSPKDYIRLPKRHRLFVVADTHGEFELLAELLQRHRILDEHLRWNFRNGHLVFLGDVFDRGPNHTEILWLIYKLEAEARRAGGGTHLLLGNHETKVLRGDLRDLNAKYRRSAEILAAQSYSELFNSDSVLGQWLRTKPAVQKIGNFLCLHGGISRALIDSGLTLADINTSVRAVLDNSLPEAGPEQERAQFIMGQLGPLWYRGYFAEHKNYPTATQADIDLIHQYFDVREILVGHTIVPTITSFYDGKVIAVQVYPRRDEQTGEKQMEALRIENGRFYRASIDGTETDLFPDRRPQATNPATAH